MLDRDDHRSIQSIGPLHSVGMHTKVTSGQTTCDATAIINGPAGRNHRGLGVDLLTNPPPTLLSGKIPIGRALSNLSHNFLMEAMDGG